ncbi:hypothetical protein GCM10022221_27660 [Actinocorallia aurea]
MRGKSIRIALGVVPTLAVAACAGVYFGRDALTPYPDGFFARREFTAGMGDHYDGDLTLGEDGLLITV